ncbi:MAG: aminodeoxychorismate synthase component I [Sulfurospirillum sp.]|nr:aminodeoxychorismate synthase component I [Sulfurospirillum sp.]
MLDEFIDKFNALGTKKEPFFFAIDFLAKLAILGDEKVLFRLDTKQNYTTKKTSQLAKIEKIFTSFNAYQIAFETLKDEIKKGNTYLLNLTCKTALKGEVDLEAIFHQSNAPFKVLVPDHFVCFSPERFVKIQDNIIKTYPMKGTVDASVENASEKILADKKEMSEHVMVVDLLRNDLGIVAKDIKVTKFRYIQKIQAGQKELLQVSSEIQGDLGENWQCNIGSILAKLLPAGSISGTPKKKTLSLIEEIEGYERGFFTGVFGYFDGANLDSAVMIRFIEKTKDGYVYKSGGGITIDSDLRSEYQEMMDKVYVPVL